MISSEHCQSWNWPLRQVLSTKQGTTKLFMKLSMTAYLNCCLMLGECIEGSTLCVAGLVAGRVPDIEEVIVATTCQVFAVGRPLESTHLLSVAGQSRHMVLRYTHIMVVNRPTPRTATKHKVQTYYYRNATNMRYKHTTNFNATKYKVQPHH